MVVKDGPLSCKVTRKLKTFVKGGSYGSLSHLPQKSIHCVMYGLYCFCVPGDQDLRMMSGALPETFLC